jgi:hypothetical protein
MLYKHFRGPYFETEIPTDWVISSDLTYQAIFYAPPDLDNRMGSNLSVIIRSPFSSEDFQEVINANNESLQTLDGFTLHESDDMQLGDVPAYWHLFTWRNVEGLPILQQQLLIIADEKLFMFTSTRPYELEDTDVLDAAFNHIFESVRIFQ